MARAKNPTRKKTDNIPKAVQAVKAENIKAPGLDASASDWHNVSFADSKNNKTIATGEDELAALLLGIGAKRTLPTKTSKEGVVTQLISVAAVKKSFEGLGDNYRLLSSTAKPATAVAINSTMRGWLKRERKNALRVGRDCDAVNALFNDAAEIMPTAIDVDVARVDSTISMLNGLLKK